jgi:cytochrome c5
MTMKWFSITMLSIVATASSAAICQSDSQNAKKMKSTAAALAPKPAQLVHSEEGQQIFAANCSRCHQTPEGFSPSISNTVVRHMRIRANLSAHDEQELRRFFNP